MPSRVRAVIYLVLLLGAPAAFSEEEKLSAYKIGLLPEPTISAHNITLLLNEFFVFERQDTSDGTTSISIDASQDTIFVDLSFDGYVDDSLLGERYRLVIRRDDERLVLEKFGRQFVCARGSNVGKPQTKFCP